MARIGFLGLGKMGSGMAGCLLAAGHQVSVWNRSADKAAPLVEQGARAAASPAEAADGADAIFAMISDDAASSRVWEAEDGAFTAAPAGALVIECSTISHGQVLRLSKAAGERGLTYIDSPVNGPPAAAAKGELILLVGASEEDLAKARPFLEVVSSSILHFGAVGTGSAFKLTNNLMGAVHIAALAEVAALAERLGLDKETLIAAIDSGPCASPHVKRLVRPMVEGRLSDVAGLSIGLREKDSRYCLGLADDSGQGMDLGRVAHAWYALAAGSLGAEDDSALLQTVAKQGGRLPDRSESPPAGAQSR